MTANSTCENSQHRLRLSFDLFHEADPILIQDMAGRIIDMNESAEQMFGWKRDELLGRESSVLIPDDLRDETAALLRRCRRWERVRDVETTRRRKSGKRLAVSVTMAILRDERRKPEAVVWLARDISRRKRAEEERARYAAELEATNRALRENIEKRSAAEAEARQASRRHEEFLAMLSHELRNPMSALLNAADVLDRVLPAEAGNEPREVIRRQGRQMARLLDDLLDVSRVTQGKIEIRREVFDLTSVVDEALETVRPTIDAHRHEVIVRIADKPLYVEGDRARLRQVLENLLVNAAKYTPLGGHIWMTLCRDGDVADVRIRDDGIGIAADMLECIFELFVQSNNTTGGSGGGIGLGLTLVKHLVRLQGGTVTAQSDGPQQGSTLIVRLPLTDKRPFQQRSPNAPSRTDAGMKIVLVEDNADARRMLKSLLELEGYQVVAVEDGERGLATILAERPGAALVDIGLPKLDGYGVARQVRAAQAGHELYLVALTGYGQQKDRTAVLEAGFDEHVVKPVNMQELTRVLRRPHQPR